MAPRPVQAVPGRRNPRAIAGTITSYPGPRAGTSFFWSSTMRIENPIEGIRIRVRPAFSLARSDLASGTWVFSYHVELENEGSDAARLLFRHWLIHDSAGEDTEVDGEGVVGEQPLLQPGDFHTYSSFCVLRSPVGYMEGYYTFSRPGGERFRVPVPRFSLQAPLATGLAEDDEQPRQMN